MTGYWETLDGAAGQPRQVWVHVTDPTYSQRRDDISRTQLPGPHDRYTWLRLGDHPDAVELAATDDGVAVRHGGARFSSVALTFPAEAFTAFLTALGATPTGDLAALITTAGEREKEAVARPRPPSLLETLAPGEGYRKALAWLDWLDRHRRRPSA
jgi:Domain of unknown function (DUF397)